MSDNSAIEWTDTTWNPVSGCDRVSPGCDHCYALTLAKRLKAMGNPKYQQDGSLSTSGPGFGVTFHEDALSIPAKWRKPRRVFVNSMGDLFHAEVLDHEIARVFAVMAQHPQHTFQVLTKRHARMRSLLCGDLYDLMARDLEEGEDRPAQNLRWPLPNVWLGVSVENQQWADIRIPALLDTPAAVRFLSCEPLLGPINFRVCVCGHRWDQHDSPDGYETSCTVCFDDESQDGCADYESRTDLNTAAIDWVIVGGESGPGARPMLLPWALSLRDQCVAAGIPFLFKQYGAWVPTKTLSVGHLSDPRELHGEQVVDDCHPNITWRRLYRRVGKKAAGRELDGRTWDEFPAVASE